MAKWYVSVKLEIQRLRVQILTWLLAEMVPLCHSSTSWSCSKIANCFYWNFNLATSMLNLKYLFVVFLKESFLF